ncbi:MAG: glycoside hydrolase family 71/99-like protein [Bdellovibrionales bacterium]
MGLQYTFKITFVSALLLNILACSPVAFKAANETSEKVTAIKPTPPPLNPNLPYDPNAPIPGFQPMDFRNMVLAGYQGWFSTPGDGQLNRWGHWSAGNSPAPNRITFEQYPNVSEYPAASLVTTDLGPLGNGQPSKLFSSFHPGVVDTHFRWMSEYGIDGVCSGRFMVATYSSVELAARNKMVELIKKYAHYYRRYFYISYDLTNARLDSLEADLTRDWTNELDGRLSVTASPVYARTSGKPVIMLWGIDGGSMNQALALKLVRFFKNRGFYVIGGTQWGWRDNHAWHEVYRELSMIQPWSVGAYASDEDTENFHKGVAVPDRQFLDANWGIDYQKVISPGFAWSNWGGGPRNPFSRRGGDYMWHQAYWASEVSDGALIAMFDEYDEATAIAKSAENASQAPQSQYFLTLDADGVSVSSDFYLRLTGEITKLMRGARSRVFNVPIPRR